MDRAKTPRIYLESALVRSQVTQEIQEVIHHVNSRGKCSTLLLNVVEEVVFFYFYNPFLSFGAAP